jgi:hypothetical protein
MQVLNKSTTETETVCELLIQIRQLQRAQLLDCRAKLLARLRRTQAGHAKSRAHSGQRQNRTILTGPGGNHEWEAVQEMFLASRPRFIGLAYSILASGSWPAEEQSAPHLSASAHGLAMPLREVLVRVHARLARATDHRLMLEAA